MADDEYVVLTMCHCDERGGRRRGHPDPDCYDHWQVGIAGSGYDPGSGHVVTARDVSGGFSSRADAQLFADAKNRGVA